MLLDADIREPLFDFLEETYGKSRIFEEKRIGRSRADVFMATESALFGIEIKSDADSYTRLTRQVRDYDKFYDYNIVAIGSSHVGHICEHIPDYWGIITIDEVEGKPDFYYFRKPQMNNKAKMVNKLRFMWRPELVEIQALNEMPKYKEKSKDFVIKNIAERIEYPENRKGKIQENIIQKQICELLLARDYSVIESEIQEYRRNKKRSF